MSASDRAAVKKLLSDAGVKLVNFGVTGLPKAEDQSRKTFEFAADMGIETIVSEPEPDAMDTVEKLCDEYKINVALHNHPRPSRYWNPDTVLEACRDRSKRIGSCADTGHWMRSDLNPLEQLKKLEGRIISLHFKDLNKYGRDAHDVPWGTGEGNVPALSKNCSASNSRACFRSNTNTIGPRRCPRSPSASRRSTSWPRRWPKSESRVPQECSWIDSAPRHKARADRSRKRQFRGPRILWISRAARPRRGGPVVPYGRAQTVLLLLPVRSPRIRGLALPSVGHALRRRRLWIAPLPHGWQSKPTDD